MTGVFSLWLPILASAAAVFVLSSIIHMALPFWHRTDCKAVPEADKVADFLRPLNLAPGDYMLPYPPRRKAERAAFAEKWNRGPVFMATVFANGDMGMGRNLGLWFLYTLVVSFCAGAMVYSARPEGPRIVGHHVIAHFAGFTAFLAYAAALWPFSIWYRRSWITTVKSTVDGLVYAVATGMAFALLWPH